MEAAVRLQSIVFYGCVHCGFFRSLCCVFPGAVVHFGLVVVVSTRFLILRLGQPWGDGGHPNNLHRRLIFRPDYRTVFVGPAPRDDLQL